MDHYKKIKDLFDLIWSEDRVELILNNDWKKLQSFAKSLKGEIDKAFEDLESLNDLEARKDYLKTLPEELKQTMLITLTRKMNAYKNNVVELEDRREVKQNITYQVNGEYIIH